MVEQQDFFKEKTPATKPQEVPAAIAEVMEAAEVGTVITEKTEHDIRDQAQPIVAQAEALTIINEPDQAHAAEVLKSIKREIKAAKKKLDPVCDASHKAWKANTELRKELIGPFQEAEKVIKNKIAVFVSEQEEIARKKQAELDAKARREEEKKRQELEERANKWEEKGNHEKAEMLRDEAETATVTPDIAAPAVGKIKGVSTSETWTFEITDINQVPKEYMLVNEKALSALAKTTKGAVVIPGVRFFTKKSISVRG